MQRWHHPGDSDDPEHQRDGPVTLPWLSSESFLSVGDKLVSSTVDGNVGEFHLAMQEDGNLVIYHTIHSAITERDEPVPVWSSRTSGAVGDYFLVLRSDSNLALYPGADGNVNGEAIWTTKSAPIANEKSFHMTMQDDGKLAIYRGVSPKEQGGLVRRMRPRYVHVNK